MSFNSFGRVLRFTTWGESHGPALGAVVDGCPPRLSLSEGDIQPFLDKRRPGQSRHTTQRQEPDQVRILSGTFEGKTTGTPISLMIENVDQRSKDYGEIAQAYRPGHADYAYDAKYGIRDYRGGGRSSARETAARVAAGGVARLIIPEVQIHAWVAEIGGDAIDPANFDLEEIDRNPFFCPDPAAAQRWEGLMDAARKAGSSLGAVIECAASGVPAGWGAPIYAKLDSDLAAAMMGINAVKGVEIGAGIPRGAPARRGKRRPDAPRERRQQPPRFPVEQCRRHRGRHLDRPAGRRARRVQADQLDPHPRADDQQGGRGGRHRHQGAPRPLRWYPRRTGGRGDDGARPRRPQAAAQGAERLT